MASARNRNPKQEAVAARLGVMYLRRLEGGGLPVMSVLARFAVLSLLAAALASPVRAAGGTPAPPTATTGSAALPPPELEGFPYTADLYGSVCTNWADTTVWYRYSRTDPGSCDDTFGARAPATGGTLVPAATGPLEICGYHPQSTNLLAFGATYYYCVIATNSAGTTYGAVKSFVVPPGSPSVVAVGASAVTATSATLEGQVHPQGGGTTAWFRLSTSPLPPNCTASGTQIPSYGGVGVGSGLSWVDFAQPVAGLTPSTTYYFCTVAQNSIGTSSGFASSFTTLALPSVTTLAVDGALPTSATLAGTANPNGVDATGWFRISSSDPIACSDAFGTRVPGSGGTALGGGTSGVDFSQAITGLQPGRTYFVCAIAETLAGMGFGSVVAFTTAPTTPATVTSPAAAVHDAGGTLNGSATPNGDAATGWFRIATSDPGSCDDAFGIRAPATGGTVLGSGTNPVAFSRPLSGLVRGTTYYFCAIAGNGLGSTFGDVESFVPGSTSPVVATEAASAVGSTVVTLQGTVNPNGTFCTGWYRYGTAVPTTCDDAYGTRVPLAGGTALGSGATPVAFGLVVSGLLPLTDYHYCAAASNAGGVTFGDVRTFTTAAAPPIIASVNVTAGKTGTITFDARANPRGSETTGWFRVGSNFISACDDAFGTRWPATGGTALGSGRADMPFSGVASGLGAGVHYVCAIASNPAGLAFSDPIGVRVDDQQPAGGCGCTAGTSPGAGILVALLLIPLAAPRSRRGAAYLGGRSSPRPTATR